ncbi:GIY-YIG nuclease family protein [Patescibacteria group bacterium]
MSDLSIGLWFMANPTLLDKDFFYVYILLLKNDQFYSGLSNNLTRRIAEHREGKVRSTRHRVPFKLIYFESYLNKKDAEKRERYFKTTKGKRVLKLQLKNFLGGVV